MTHFVYVKELPSDIFITGVSSDSMLINDRPARGLMIRTARMDFFKALALHERFEHAIEAYSTSYPPYYGEIQWAGQQLAICTGLQVTEDNQTAIRLDCAKDRILAMLPVDEGVLLSRLKSYPKWIISEALAELELEKQTRKISRLHARNGTEIITFDKAQGLA